MLEKTIKGRKLLHPGSEYPSDNTFNGGGTLVGHLKGLISLQTCDSRILDIRRRIERGPAKIKELEQELTLVEKRLRGDADQIEESKGQRRKAEQGIDDLEARIAKSNTKLSLIKSNKEYTAALKEIDDLGREKSLLEDTVLEMMEQVEGLEKGLAETKGEIAEQKERVQQEKEEIAAQVKALEVELEALESQRANLCGAIDDGLLKRYDFIRKHRGGLAVSPVVKGVCLTCHIGIPPQKFNELIRGDELMDCPNCQRIIYWGEDERLQGGIEEKKAGMLEQNR